jgi:hypothetical protein
VLDEDFKQEDGWGVVPIVRGRWLARAQRREVKPNWAERPSIVLVQKTAFQSHINLGERRR